MFRMRPFRQVFKILDFIQGTMALEKATMAWLGRSLKSDAKNLGGK